MTGEPNCETAHCDEEHSHEHNWGPKDSATLQFRLRAIARHRPRAVAGVIDYWLGTRHGESDFDVRG